MPTDPAASGLFNGWSWGLGTPFRVAQAQGFEDLPSVRRRATARSQQDGQWFGPTLLDQLQFQIAFHVQPTATRTVDQALNDLRMATHGLRDTAVPLFWNANTRMALVRVADRKIQREAGGVDYARASVQWEAIYPKIFEEPLRQVTLSPVPASGGGVGVPFRVPVRVVTAAGVALQLTNIGNEETFPVVMIHGVAANPRLVELISGQQVQFLTTLNAGDQLVVDFSTQTAILNGQTARTETADSDWWSIPGGDLSGPGSALVGFYADTFDSNALATVQWRSAWA